MRTCLLLFLLALVSISALVAFQRSSGPAWPTLCQGTRNPTGPSLSESAPACPPCQCTQGHEVHDVSSGPQEAQEGGQKLFLGVFSGPGYERMRDIWRNEWECGKQLKAAGVPYKFLLGWPVDVKRALTDHKNNQFATSVEVDRANELRNESAKYQDMKFFHYPDTYMTLQSKTFALLSYAYSLGVSYVVKLDDDACVNATKLLKKIEEHETLAAAGKVPAALYAGTQFIRSRSGKDNLNHPYYIGRMYILSKDLVKAIVEDDAENSVLFAPYGFFDEDAETGAWVGYAAQHHKIKIHWMNWDDSMYDNSTHFKKKR